MQVKLRIPKIAVATFFAMAVLAGPAAAYIGPGIGLSVIGTLVAVVGAGFLLLVGFVWYPIKRLLKRSKQSAEPTENSVPNDAD